MARYQRRSEKLKEEKDVRDAVKKDLQCQLDAALSKAEANATAGVERAAKAK